MTDDEWWQDFDPEFYAVYEIDKLADQPDENIWTKFENEHDEVVTLKPGRHLGGDGYYHSAKAWRPEHLELVITANFDVDYASPECLLGAHLNDRWVVILMDPDDSDWSPWSVTASDKRQAILKAQAEWRRWSRVHAAAEVTKVYRNSWIGEIV